MRVNCNQYKVNTNCYSTSYVVDTSYTGSNVQRRISLEGFSKQREPMQQEMPTARNKVLSSLKSEKQKQSLKHDLYHQRWLRDYI